MNGRTVSILKPLGNRISDGRVLWNIVSNLSPFNSGESLKIMGIDDIRKNAYIQNMYVSPSYRRCGIGRKLVSNSERTYNNYFVCNGDGVSVV